MSKKNVKLIKKSGITVALILALLMLIREALILTRFIQNVDDKNFDAVLFSKLEMNRPVKVSDIYGEEWKEVCVLYPYDDPKFNKIVIPYRNQLIEDYYFNGLMGIGIPPFLLKYDDRIWWIFFVDNENKIIKLFRSQGRPKLNPPRGSDAKIDVDGRRYVSVDMRKKCAGRDKAYFIQNDAYSDAIKYFVFYEKE